MKGDNMKKLLVLVPIMFLVIGCGGGEKNYYPLTEGNTWDYRTITTVTIDTTTTVDTGSVNVEITVKTTLDNGTEVYEQVSTIDTLKDTSYVQKTDDYLLSYSDKADTVPDTTATLPIEEGNTWTVTSDTNYTETGKVLGKESVTVPAGSYDDCWKIAYISDGETTFVYLAPDIGMVKVHQAMVIDTNITSDFTMELESSTIK